MDRGDESHGLNEAPQRIRRWESSGYRRAALVTDSRPLNLYVVNSALEFETLYPERRSCEGQDDHPSPKSETRAPLSVNDCRILGSDRVMKPCLALWSLIPQT